MMLVAAVLLVEPPRTTTETAVAITSPPATAAAYGPATCHEPKLPSGNIIAEYISAVLAPAVVV